MAERKSLLPALGRGRGCASQLRVPVCWVSSAHVCQLMLHPPCQLPTGALPAEQPPPEQVPSGARGRAEARPESCRGLQLRGLRSKSLADNQPSNLLHPSQPRGSSQGLGWWCTAGHHRSLTPEDALATNQILLPASTKPSWPLLALCSTWQPAQPVPIQEGKALLRPLQTTGPLGQRECQTKELVLSCAEWGKALRSDSSGDHTGGAINLLIYAWRSPLMFNKRSKIQFLPAGTKSQASL